MRNCPWSGVVWEAALRALERSGAPDEAHAALAEQALAAGLQVNCEACWGLPALACCLFNIWIA